VVFLHGVLSSGEACWTHKNGTYWPDLVAEEFNGALDIYVFTYKTSILSGGFSVGDITASMNIHFGLDDVLQAQNVVFVCHSMGGIVARKFILRYREKLAERKMRIGLFLLGSPSRGSRYANLLGPLIRIFEHSQGEILQFSARNHWLAELDVEFTDLKEHRRLPISGQELVEDRFVVGRGLLRRQVVEPFSGRGYFGDSYKVPDTDHFSICKVASAGDIQHRMLLDFLEDFAGDAVKREAVPGKTSTRPSSPPQPFRPEDRLHDDVPFQAPNPPASFIDRPEITVGLKELLVPSAGRQALVVSAIQGLGGIGKTALASFIAHDPDVQLTFKDGILWATLGQEPDLQQWLNNWIQALGDFDFKSNDPQTASKHLQSLLHNRRTLMIVDDVWSATDARLFLVGGENCKIILTTRLRDIAQEVNAHLCEIGLLTEGQAIALVEARMGRTLAADEADFAQEMVKAVGYLPLAVELLAAQVARGVPWDELVAAFRSEIARLEALEAPRQRRSGESKLEACFNLSLDRLRREDVSGWRTFVMLGILPEDTPFDAEIVSNAQDLSRQEAADILGLLYDDALVMRSSASRVKRGTSVPTYRLHDLLYDIARKLLVSPAPAGLELTLKETHRQLVANYAALLKEGRWSSVPDDGYIRRHLFRHLIAADLSETMEAILEEEDGDGSNAWFTSSDREGYASGYAEDVELAISRTLDNWGSDTTLVPGAIVILKHALGLASINSIASNSPPELMVARVKSGAWLPEQALAYARLIGVRTQRLEAFAFLMPLQEPASASEISKVLCSELIDDTSITAEEVCGFLARDLPVSVSMQVNSRLLASSRFYGIGRLRAEAIFKIARYLSERLRQTLLTEILGWDGGIERIIALTSLLPYLTTHEQLVEDTIELDTENLPSTAGWARNYARACIIGMKKRRNGEVGDSELSSFLSQIPESYSTKRAFAQKLICAARPETVPTFLDFHGAPDDSFVRNLSERMLHFGGTEIEKLFTAFTRPYHRGIVAATAALAEQDAVERTRWIDTAHEQAQILGDAKYFQLNAFVIHLRTERADCELINNKGEMLFNSLHGDLRQLATMAILAFCQGPIQSVPRQRFFTALINDETGNAEPEGLTIARQFAGSAHLSQISQRYSIETVGDLLNSHYEAFIDLPGHLTDGMPDAARAAIKENREFRRNLTKPDLAFVVAAKLAEAGLADRGWRYCLPWLREKNVAVDLKLLAAIGLQDKSFSVEDLIAFGSALIASHGPLPPCLREAVTRTESVRAEQLLLDVACMGRDTMRSTMLLHIFLLQCLISDEAKSVLDSVGDMYGKILRWWPAA